MVLKKSGKQVINRDLLINTLKSQIQKELKKTGGELSGSWLLGEPHLLITPNHIISFSDIDVIHDDSSYFDMSNSMSIQLNYDDIKIDFESISHKHKRFDVDLYVQKQIYESLENSTYEKVFSFWFYVSIIEVICKVSADRNNPLRLQYHINKAFLHNLMNLPGYIFNTDKSYSRLIRSYVEDFGDIKFAKSIYDIKTGDHPVSLFNSLRLYANKLEKVLEKLQRDKHLEESTCTELLDVFKNLQIYFNYNNKSKLVELFRKNMITDHDKNIVNYQVGKLFKDGR